RWLKQISEPTGSAIAQTKSVPSATGYLCHRLHPVGRDQRVLEVAVPARRCRAVNSEYKLVEARLASGGARAVTTLASCHEPRQISTSLLGLIHILLDRLPRRVRIQ